MDRLGENLRSTAIIALLDQPNPKACSFQQAANGLSMTQSLAASPVPESHVAGDKKKTRRSEATCYLLIFPFSTLASLC